MTLKYMFLPQAFLPPFPSPMCKAFLDFGSYKKSLAVFKILKSVFQFYFCSSLQK